MMLSELKNISSQQIDLKNLEENKLLSESFSFRKVGDGEMCQFQLATRSLTHVAKSYCRKRNKNLSEEAVHK